VNIVNPERFRNLVDEAKQAVFSGWDFSWLDGRMLQDDLPWNYPDLVKKNPDGVHSLLDMGTGGGELLASLAPLPPDTHATEAHPPNQVLARERLSPLGVEIHTIDEKNPLPFNENRFEMVINRHESFDPAELSRILKPDGLFITQQVGGLNNLELNQFFEDKFTSPFMDLGLAPLLTRLYETDLQVERAEKATLRSTFLDIGAVVYYLKVITWQVIGFDPDSHEDRLIALHNIIEREGQFVTSAHRFMLIARKKVSSV